MMEAALMLGTAKVDITPAKPVPLAGFAHRKGDPEHIASRLYARIHSLERSDEAGIRTAALLISADLIWWGTDFVQTLKTKLQEHYGYETVLLHATHNHSGPQTSGSFTEAIGKPDPHYLAELERKLMNGIVLARQNIEPVTIERGTGQCQIGVNRRKVTKEGVIMAPNDEGPVDPEVTVIRFRSQDDKIKGLFVHYTCHPTTTGDNVVSSEYCGAALERIEQMLGGDPVGVFLQGCCGDIRPALVQDGQFYRGHQLAVEQFGQKLANEALRINGQPMEKLTPCGLTGNTFMVSLPFQTVPGPIELEEQKDRDDIYGEWARLLLQDPWRRRESIPLEMTRLDIAKALSLITFNAEMVVDYGLFVKKASRGNMLPLAYTNGMIGYVPTKEQLLQGGYESRDSVPYFGLPSVFDFGIEGAILNTILQAIGEKHNEE